MRVLAGGSKRNAAAAEHTPAHNLQCSRSAPRRKPDTRAQVSVLLLLMLDTEQKIGEGARGELTEVLTFLGCGSSFVRSLGLSGRGKNS